MAERLITITAATLMMLYPGRAIVTDGSVKVLDVQLGPQIKYECNSGSHLTFNEYPAPPEFPPIIKVECHPDDPGPSS
jgi:hypothetical protein